MGTIWPWIAGFFAFVFLYAKAHAEQVDKMVGKSALAASSVAIIFGFTAEQWGALSIVIGIVFTIFLGSLGIWLKWLQIKELREKGIQK